MKNEIDKVSKKGTVYPMIRLLAQITAKRHKDNTAKHPIIFQEKAKTEESSK